jgi:hypothetical protein
MPVCPPSNYTIGNTMTAMIYPVNLHIIFVLILDIRTRKEGREQSPLKSKIFKGKKNY